MLQEDTNKEVQKNNSVSKLGLPLNSAYTKEESRDEQEIDIPLTALNKVRIRLRVKPSPPHAESLYLSTKRQQHAGEEYQTLV